MADQVDMYKFFNEVLPNMPPVSEADRYSAACLALGREAAAPSFYVTMKSASPSACMSQPVLPASIRYSMTASASTENTAPASSCDVMEQWRTVSNRIETLLSNGDDVELALSRMGQRDSVWTQCSYWLASVLVSSHFWPDCCNSHSVNVVYTVPYSKHYKKDSLLQRVKIY